MRSSSKSRPAAAATLICTPSKAIGKNIFKNKAIWCLLLFFFVFACVRRPVKPKMPLTPGHEGAGVVDQIGENVTNWKVGDKVGIAWLYEACGSCEYCVSGWETLCEKQNCCGYSVDGCFREYAIAKASHAIPLPEKLSFEQAARKRTHLLIIRARLKLLMLLYTNAVVDGSAILCAGVTSYKGLKETEARPGQFVSIVGAAGGLGHLAVQYAKAMGFRPIAVDVGAQKKKSCMDTGAEYFVDASQPNAVAEINEYTSGGSHGVLCLATNSKAFETSVNICRRKGCVVCVGLPPGGFPTPIFDVVLKRVTIRGSIVGTRQDMVEALDFAARGAVHWYVQFHCFHLLMLISDIDWLLSLTSDIV